MRSGPLFEKVDAVTIPVPDPDTGLRFYRDSLRHDLLWGNDEAGHDGLGLPGSDSELVLTTREGYAPNWLVSDADQATKTIQAARGQVITEPFDIPVGRLAVVTDPFGNVLAGSLEGPICHGRRGTSHWSSARLERT